MANSKETKTTKKTSASAKSTTKSSAKKTGSSKTTTIAKKKMNTASNKRSTDVEIKKIELQKEKESNMILTVLGIIILVIVAIIIFRLTYAFFTANIKEISPNENDVDIQTADLLVRYVDGESDFELGSKIEPGDTITKNFSVVNDGNDTGYYTIILEKLINTFDVECKSSDDEDKGEISYTLYQTDENFSDENNSTIGLGDVTLPCTENPITVVLAEHVSVDVGTTNYYKLLITYKNLSIDQSDNMENGSLSAKINIVESELEKRTTN